MLNATNATLNATSHAASPTVGQALAVIFTVLIPELLRRLFVFIAAPFLYPDMWWLLVHLILTFVLFEMYFERHDGEDLGWGAALANSIVVVFISMELLRSLFDNKGSPFTVFWQILVGVWQHGLFAERNIIIILVLLLGAFGLLTAVINYFHFLPRRIAFLISGHKVVNLLAYFLIVVVYRFDAGSSLPLDSVTLVALLMFGALLWSLLFWVNHRGHKRAAKKSRIIPFK